ncbi:MAG: O-methyltransferase [Hyphomicrobiaceae bacterium]|nr:O-methyltransferase [Hyphomicrobiaceae bacterium]
MSDANWTAVDGYFSERLLAADIALEAVLAANAAAGLPAIDVSPLQGKMLALFARMAGARRVLEIGTLGGYSTIWLAGAVGATGHVVTLELDPRHAAVAAANVDRAGFADRVDIRVGRARDTLDAMIARGDGPFDLVFIDADKPNNPHYLKAALALSRVGTVIVADNVVRDGKVIDPASDDDRVRGTRALFDLIAAEPRLDATAVQTVGVKGHDGFCLALVVG